MKHLIPYYTYEAALCAKAAYAATPPSNRYARAVTQLMLGTMAHESHFYYRRQTVFSWDSTRGAWGIGQMEAVGIQRALNSVQKRPAVADNLGRWLFGQDDDDLAIFKRIRTSMDMHDLCRILSGWDRLSLCFMRLYYLDCPGAIPPTLEGQANYWKQHWNTSAGKGTPEQYIENWKRLVAPHLPAEFQHSDL